jgi:hypothetical protein
MVASRSRKISKLLFSPLLAAGLLFASSGAFSSPISADGVPVLPVPDAQATDYSRPLDFVKEQAMSSTQLIERWTPLIQEAARRFKLSEAWIRAVILKESGGRTLLDNKPITSNAGAMGIMQLMPTTYDAMREQHGLGNDPYDPRDNVLAGAAYLSWLYERYGYPRMFAAYNAGPRRLEAQLAGRVRQLPAETRAYVSGIVQILGTKIFGTKLDPVLATNGDAVPSASRVATLTRPDGSSVTIDKATVKKIRAALRDEYAPGVKTVVSFGNVQQGVREDLATVSSLLGVHRGKSRTRRVRGQYLVASNGRTQG